MVGGLLLQTTRHTVVKSCDHRFSKFLTTCTKQQTIYDAETGKEVSQADVVEGLAPYGVDAVFLASSSEYDEDLVVGECLRANKHATCKSHCKHQFANACCSLHASNRVTGPHEAKPHKAFYQS